MLDHRRRRRTSAAVAPLFRNKKHKQRRACDQQTRAFARPTSTSERASGRRADVSKRRTRRWAPPIKRRANISPLVFLAAHCTCGFWCAVDRLSNRSSLANEHLDLLDFCSRFYEHSFFLLILFYSLHAPQTAAYRRFHHAVDHERIKSILRHSEPGDKLRQGHRRRERLAACSLRSKIRFLSSSRRHKAAPLCAGRIFRVSRHDNSRIGLLPKTR